MLYLEDTNNVLLGLGLGLGLENKERSKEDQKYY